MTLAEKLQDLKTLDAEILDLVEDEGVIADEITKADKFKEEAYATMVRLDRALRSPTPVRSTEEESARRPVSLASTTTTHAHSHIKLPKLTIAPFNGELTAWTPFWESYETTSYPQES